MMRLMREREGGCAPFIGNTLVTGEAAGAGADTDLPGPLHQLSNQRALNQFNIHQQTLLFVN